MLVGDNRNDAPCSTFGFLIWCRVSAVTAEIIDLPTPVGALRTIVLNPASRKFSKRRLIVSTCPSLGVKLSFLKDSKICVSYFIFSSVC